jgi:hypothetical protein
MRTNVKKPQALTERIGAEFVLEGEELERYLRGELRAE